MDKILKAQEETKDKFFKTQAERLYYLQEFKENVIISLEKKDVETGIISTEILEGLREPDAVLLKMRRDVPLKFWKPYIEEAEKLKLRYTLIDSAGLVGDIVLVVVSKDALENKESDVKTNSLEEQFEKAGLSPIYAKCFGGEICEKHYNELVKKLPLYKGNFKKIKLLEKIFGKTCPICQEEKIKKW